MTNTERLYLRLLEDNKDALEEQLFTVAYHALAGALNCALSIGNVTKLEKVGQLAHEQWQAIGAQSNKSNNTTLLMLYSNIWHMAEARAVIIKHGGKPS